MIVKRRTRGTNGIRPARLAEVSFSTTLRSNATTIPVPNLHYYHLGLHYSQTKQRPEQSPALFYYHLGLHYSQTVNLFVSRRCTFYYHLGLHYSQTSNFKTAGISFGKIGKLAVFLRFGAALRHYNRVSGGSKTIIAHESKFAKVFVDDPHLLTGSDRLFLSALQQENGQFFIKHRLIKKRYFILRKE